MPGLILPKEKIDQFAFILGLNTNEKIYKFILDNIEKEENNEKISYKYMKAKKRYSYHQIIFLLIFLLVNIINLNANYKFVKVIMMLQLSVLNFFQKIYNILR